MPPDKKKAAPLSTAGGSGDPQANDDGAAPATPKHPKKVQGRLISFFNPQHNMFQPLAEDDSDFR